MEFKVCILGIGRIVASAFGLLVLFDVAAEGLIVEHPLRLLKG